jgi:hypothetical protein
MVRGGKVAAHRPGLSADASTGVVARRRAIVGAGIRGCDTMPVMAVSDKSAALDALYGRIASIAREKGGATVRVSVSVSHESQTVAEHQSEDAPALHAEMPSKFRVEFTPSGPLSTPFVLSVNVRRFHHDAQKNGSSVSFVNDEWRVAQTPLSDDQIRAWLTLDGLPPAFY